MPQLGLDIFVQGDTINVRHLYIISSGAFTFPMILVIKCAYCD